ncbi:hypothetical protein [Azohydromonas caseinilytica]|uniref:Transmembrane protein n=1 Tax=Azohydromonas caseinilytica TaxID=2728836 RepID=A0A848F5F2_9BURK|nr:hypothetical protein [Azohydromonas caseinilytica]NML14834.1 hypothetical protein [Azohydromonas caseinilytica]
MLLLIWTLAALGLAMCALLSWALYALLRMDPSWLGDLPGLAQRLPYQQWLDDLFPGWEQLLAWAVDVAQWMLGWAGAAAPVVAWIFFALCASFVLIGAALLTVAVKLLRRKNAPARASA